MSLLEKKSVEIRAKLFRGFSDPSRLKILDALKERPLVVSEIVEITGLTQSNVSNHLACLRECGIVDSEQKGKYVTYRLSDPKVEQFLKLSEELVAEVAKGIYMCTHYSRTVGK
ncbi:MAG: metalloregulator ArsR/SmtB family transcription factor [Actinomycetota bacterium]